MIDEALSEIGKTPDEFYGYIDSWIGGGYGCCSSVETA